MRGCGYALVVIAIVAAGTGCQYLEMVQRRRAMRAAFASEPRLALQMALAPEDCFRLAGRVASAEKRDEPLLVAAIGHRFAVDEVVAWKLVARPLELYSLLLPEGDYELLAFADLDRDGVFASTELVGGGDTVRVGATVSRDGFLVDGPTVRVDLERPSVASVPIRIELTRTHNVLPSLGDDFFALRWGQRGLYHPTELLLHTQGYFFGLEEPDPAKTQVVFVHGAGGAPVEFTHVVEGLDRTQYQPWFFFYPSGLPLAQTAAVLKQVLEIAAEDLGLRRVAIVAHSMGGLVAHAALGLLCHDGVPDWMALFVSIATPYDGHAAAQRGVERASEVVPSWRDMAPGSPFLHELHATPLPDGLPFYLVFAYDNRARIRPVPSGDGTVVLHSQLAFPVHLRSWRSFGVDATHTGVLTDPTARSLLVDLLAERAAPRGAVTHAFTRLGHALGGVVPPLGRDESR